VKPRSVLLVEPYADGHHAVWLRWICEQLSERGWNVGVATSEEALHQPSLSWIAAAPKGIRVTATAALPMAPEAVPSSLGSRQVLRRELSCHRLLRTLYRRALRAQAIDMVLLPFGDYILHAAALLGTPFGRARWATIVMRPTFHYADAGIIAPRRSLVALRRAMFTAFVLRNSSLSSCLTIDQPLYEYMQASRFLARKAVYLPDAVGPLVAFSRAHARAALGIPDQAVVVLLYGDVSLRKGLMPLLGAARVLDQQHVHVLIVGMLSEGARRVLAEADALELQANSRLHVVDGWASEASEGMAFAAADVAWLGYTAHWQSSGVMVQAARIGLPLLACEEGLIGWTTRRHWCGLTVPMSQRQAVIEALDQLTSSADLRRQLGERGRQAFAGNTIENAGEILAAALA
jgi:glycosyltransferase involved in cell wall biosynthesis